MSWSSHDLYLWVVNSRSNIVHLTAHNIDSVFLQAHQHALFCLLCLALVRSILEEAVNDLFTVRISKSELCCCLSTFTSIHSKTLCVWSISATKAFSIK